MLVYCLLHAGLQDCLLGLHTWWRDVGEEPKWLAQAVQLVRNIFAQHAQEARDQGILPEDHLRSIIAVLG